MPIGSLGDELLAVEDAGNPHAVLGHEPSPVGGGGFVAPQGNRVETPQKQEGRQGDEESREGLAHES